MKLQQKDIALIAAGLIGGIFFAFIANKYFFTNQGSKNTEVDVVPAIHTDFPQQSTKYFNAQAIDPTQLINIGPNNSQQPFTGSQ